MRKERILFLVSSMGSGGAERVIQLLLNFYCKMYECDLFIVSGNTCVFKLNPKINVFYLDNKEINHSFWGKIERIIKKRREVNDYIKKMEAEGWKFILITAHLNMGYLLAAVTCKAGETTYVIHNPQKHNKGANSFLYKIAFKIFWNDKLIGAVSEGIKKELTEIYRIQPTQIEVIYNPVNIEQIKKQKEEKLFWRRDYMIAVGRLTSEKNFMRLLEVYAKGTFYKKMDLVILGDGPLREQIEKQINDLDLQKYVFLMGHCNNPYKWMEHAKVLVNTSNYEAMPMTLIEALAVGTKVVSAKCDFGPDEIMIKELKNYLVYPIDDIEQYIEKINMALKYYPPIFENYIERFSIERVADAYLKMNKVERRDESVNIYIS